MFYVLCFVYYVFLCFVVPVPMLGAGALMLNAWDWTVTIVSTVLLACDAVHITSNAAFIKPVQEEVGYCLTKVLLPAGPR